MLMGIRLQAIPTPEQRHILSQWIGCARVIWNAKCEEHRYLSVFARKYLPVGTYAPIDQKYSQFKDKELTPWLSQCPSQILRNSAVNWYKTYNNFIKGSCGKPKRKKKRDNISIHLTRELFEFKLCEDGVTRLFVGSKSNNIGFLALKTHRKFNEPKSIRIKKKNGRYWVSFCYDDPIDEKQLRTKEEHLELLRTKTASALESMVEAVDRGVCCPAQTTDVSYDFTPEQKRSLQREERKRKRLQKALQRGEQGSNRRQKKKWRIAESYEKQANIRQDFNHKTSKKLVKDADVIVFEDLKTKQMTKRPKAKVDEQTGRFLANGAKRKAGLNKAILSVGWHQLEKFTEYKAYRAGKVVLKVSAYQSSQECADCGHTHPDNRKTRELFVCQHCKRREHADVNAAKVLKKRAIKLILYSGTELSQRGVLRCDTGRGADGKTQTTRVVSAHGCEASKKKVTSVAGSSVL
ncbi:MAG TPA: transposase [Myxococcales bacterium]|nr:transposase [Myxococcales bacterium]|tara:strand:- start:282 stop:1673 length:1392 start_codon:yes stop_codon:yes gene_type:complete